MTRRIKDVTCDTRDEFGQGDGCVCGSGVLILPARRREPEL